MYQVYISSTYRDLIDFRETAAKAVRRLQCNAVAMEDYVATDERPLEQCLADVRASNVYIGLFAWRYGFTPPNHDKSITQLEYEEAGRVGIPRLIFILDETTDWPDTNRDTDPAAIQQLRVTLQETHTVSHFSSADQLDSRITAALSKHLQQHRSNGKVEIPELLPYMSNRSRQRDQLADALDIHFDRNPRRPFVVIVYGDEREAHSAFLERMERVTFPDLLKLEAEAGPVHHLDLSWSEPGGPLDERSRRLHCRLSERLTGERHMDRQAMAEELARQRCPVMVSSSVLSTDWQANESKLVEHWLNLWAEWPDLPPGQKLFIVLSFHLKDPLPLSFWAKRKLNNKNKAVCEFVTDLEALNGDELSLLTLDKLEAIREADVMIWLKEHAGKFCRESQGAIRDPLILAEQLKPWVREFFRQQSEAEESEGIHMELLARELRRQLNRCLNEGGI